jgi:hypothetical protein
MTMSYNGNDIRNNWLLHSNIIIQLLLYSIIIIIIIIGGGGGGGSVSDEQTSWVSRIILVQDH